MDTMGSSAFTTRESCARLIEHAARGYAAYECGILRSLAEGLRHLPISDLDTPSAVVLAAVRALHQIAETCGGVTPNARLISEVRERVLMEVSIDDPMEPYSDKNEWWPRRAA